MRIEYSDVLDSMDHFRDKASYIVKLELSDGKSLYIYYRNENQFYAVLPEDSEETVMRIYHLHFNGHDELDGFREFFFQENLDLLSDATRKQFEELTKAGIIKITYAKPK